MKCNGFMGGEGWFRRVFQVPDANLLLTLQQIRNRQRVFLLV